MIHHQSFVSQRPVVGGNAHLGVGLEGLADRYQIGGASTKEYGAVNSLCFQYFGEMQQGRYTNSGKFMFWLTRIAHNVIMDNYRLQQNEQIVDAGADNNLSNIRDNVVLDTCRESEIVNEQVLRDVKRLMNALPPAQREVVYMRFYQEMSFKEIAEVTGVSINTSLGRMRYALMNLRKMAKTNKMELCLDF
jgi:RNA polymerase sigma-70 factor (ECF subfamily)